VSAPHDPTFERQLLHPSKMLKVTGEGSKVPVLRALVSMRPIRPVEVATSPTR